MKKLFVISLFVSSVFNISAFAKTQGSYVGVDLINTKIDFAERYTNDVDKTPILRKPEYSGSAYGIGLHYNYALNYGGFFMSPGLILEQNSATANGHEERQMQRIQVLNRYGIKTDVGFDLTDRFAAYGTAGYVGVSYKTRNFVLPDGTGTSIKNGTKADWFYGAGLKFDCNKQTSVNLEYILKPSLQKPQQREA